MSGKVVAAVAFGYESAELDVLDSHFFATDAFAENFHEVVVLRLVSQSLYFLYFLKIKVVVESFEHAIESHFGSVGDVGEHGVLQVVVHSLEDRLHEEFAHAFALAIDVEVAAAAEIDALKRASAQVVGFVNLREAHFAFFVHQYGFAAIEFVNLFDRHIESGLYHRSLRSEHHHLVVDIPKCRTNAPRVAHGKALAATCDATHHITAVPATACPAKHIREVDVVLYGAGDFHTFETLLRETLIEVFHLAVEFVTEFFENDISVGIFARVLTVGGDFGKYFVYIGEIEVTAHSQVLGAPVVAAQKRVNIRQSAFARCGVSQVTHIEFTGKSQIVLGIFGVGE